MDIYLGAYWKFRPMTLGQYLEAVRDTIARLQAFHPMFHGLTEVGSKPNDEVTLAADLSNLKEIVLARAPVDLKESTELDMHGLPTARTRCALGFLLRFINAKSEGQGKILLSISAGEDSRWISSALVLNLDDSLPERHDAAFWRQALATIIDIWHPDSALVTSKSFRDRIFHERTPLNHIGWLQYFRGTAWQELAEPGIQFEAFAEGGLLQLAPRPPQVDDEALVTRAGHLRDLLLTHGLTTYRPQPAAPA